MGCAQVRKAHCRDARDQKQGGRMEAKTVEQILASVAQAHTLVQCAARGKLDNAVEKALALVGAAFDADRAYIFQTRDHVFIDNTHEWCAAGIASFKGDLQKVPYSVGELMWAAFKSHGVLLLPDITMVPMGTEIRQALTMQGINALIAVPIYQDAAITGFLGLDFCAGPRRFSSVDQQALLGLAATLSLALQAEFQTRKSGRLDAELRAVNERLRAMLRVAPEILLEFDADGVIVAFHHNAPLGPELNPTEIIGRPPEAVFPAQAASIIRLALQQAKTAGSSEALRYALLTDGQDKRFSVHAMMRKARGPGGAAGYLVILRDVTQSHLQDQHIRQLVRVADLSTNLIFLMDAGHRITWMNPASVNHSGIPLDEAMGKLPSEVLRLADSDPEAARIITAALDRGEDVEQEVRACSRAGQPYWVRLTIKKLCDSSNEIEAFMVVGVNVTRAKLAEARALQERAYTMDALLEGIALVQPEGRFIYINSVLRGFLKLPAEVPAQALSWHDITPPQFNALLTLLLPELYAQGSWQGEMDLREESDTGRCFDMSIAVQEDGNFLFIARDVTARKNAMREQTLLREQLQIAQSRQLVTQLAGGLAHDVANTLAVIAQVLETVKLAQDAPGALALGRIEAAVAQAQTLVRNLSQLGRRSARPSLIDLRPLVRQAAELLRPGLRSGAQLTLDLPEDPVEIRGDVTGVMQVLLNLLLNARDALRITRDQTGQITARARPCLVLDTAPAITLGHLIPGQSYAVLEISDSGEGMTPERVASIFKPYFSTKGDDGMGLGLSIVADIVATALGAIEVQSHPDRGTTLRIYWPCPHSQPANHAFAPPTLPALHGRTILLVDDDDDELLHMAQALSAAGAEVASCITPEDALDALSAEPDGWELVVTDMDMGLMSGIELGRKLRKVRANLPIVLVTGGDIGHSMTSDHGKEFAFVLRKPVSETALVAVCLDCLLRRAH
ncbi:MAG: PAS domain-containing protein [Rhodobacteraceae bacterium]|nr:MAG: PAS domain-containing protein [Paracoccaceae bacterium]